MKNRSSTLAAHVDREIVAHRRARVTGLVGEAWAALERAHILSQPALWLHLRVHALMLGFAVRLGDGGEVLGQLARLAFAPLGSLTGRTSWGNTGRADVSAFAPMPVPEDLRGLLDAPPDVPAHGRLG